MKRKPIKSRLVTRNGSVLNRSVIEPLELRTLFAALTIAQENALPGTPASTWDISGAGDTNLQGYATDISVNRGSTVNFKIDDNTVASYHVEIYRLGYYQGNGARLITTIGTANTIEKNQSNPLTNSTGLVDAGNWTVSASWAIPADATSGVYIAKLQYDSSSGASHIPFIVRNDAGASDVIFQTSDTTWQAYNNYGGNSLYVGNGATGRAYKVSYNRPFNTRSNSQEDYLFNAEYPMIRFLERNGYDVSYMSGLDTDRLGAANITRHKLFMTVGHDEYWSGNQRGNVEAARDAGTNLAIFTGNQMFWKTRWEGSIASGGDANRTLVCYKETHANAKIDPTAIWTGTWRDPRFSPPADGGRPENSVSGQIFLVNSGTLAIKVPAADGKARLWRNTTVATQSAGATATLAAETLGYEWDVDADNGSRPAGLIHLSTTSATGVEVLLDYGSTFGGGNATHSLTLYKAPSGALVFGAGTVQWSWGLDSTHDRGSNAADSRMQQATVNLFADMSAQPATLIAGLVVASKSTDITGPSVTITTPTPNGNYQLGQAVNLSGTATDSGGGVVQGVEVSIDGGQSWHPATGRATWTYSFATTTGGAQTILVRAIDDSANIGTSAPLPINVQGPTGETIFGSTIPVAPLDPDASAVELGVKFKTDINGTISGIRFYKGGSANGGTHLAHLWSITGTLLATATFSSESTSGWQAVSFTNPVAVTAGTVYVASYYAPQGRYAEDDFYFQGNGAGAGHVKALAAGVSGANGVYGLGSVFPTQNYNSSNYYVDVFFSSGSVVDTTPPTITSRTPAAGATGVAVNTTVTATFNEAINQSTLVFTLKDSLNNNIPGSTSYNSSTRVATFTPGASLANNTTYTASVIAADTAGNAMASASTSFFTTTVGDITPPVAGSLTPASGATNVAANTAVTATFNEPINQGTLVFTLKNGAVSVTGNVSYDTNTRIATFTPSSALALGATYTASISASDTTGNAMASPTAWSFTITPPDLTPPTVTSNTPATNATNVPANTAVTATFSEAINTGTLSFILKDNNGVPVPGPTASYNAATRVATFTPTNPLALGITYTAFVGASDTAGNPMTTTYSWSFTTTLPDLTPPTVTSVTPTNGSTSVATATTITATFSEDINPATILVTVSGGVTGSTSYNAANRTATFTPSSTLSFATLYNVTVTANDTAGNAMTSPAAWSFTTAAQPVAPKSIFADTVVPANPAENDGSAVNLGVKFKSDISGYITGIRFYKGSGNSGTHIGTLWSSSGISLASATFTGETATGWQTVKFATPVAITAGTIYVASYYAPNGRYAEDDNFFTSAGVNNGTLHALKNGDSGGNGVYRYATSNRFPNSSFASANYYVDVTFSTTATGSAQTQTVVTRSSAPASLQANSAISLLNKDTDPLLG